MPLLDDKVTDDTGVTVSLLALKSTEIVGHVIEVPQPQIVIDCYKDNPEDDSSTESSDEDEGASRLKFQLTPRIEHTRNFDRRGSKLSVKSTVSAFFGRQYERIKAKETKALCYALISGILMTVYSTLYNVIESEMDKSTVLAIRGFLQTSLMGSLGVCNGISFLPVRENDDDDNYDKDDSSSIGKCNTFFTSLFGRYHWFVKSMLLIFIISSTGAFRLFFIFQALQETEMGSVHSIMQGAPVLVMILGHFFLNDRLNIVRGFCSLFLIGGIALISQPDGNTEDEAMRDAVGTAYAIGALVLSAVGSVLTKVASKRFSKEIISFYIGISVLILGNLMVAFFDGSAPKFPTDFRPWMIGTFVALLGVIQQLFLIAAVKCGSPTQVTMTRSIQIVLSFVIQVDGLKQQAQVNEMAGAGLILATVCMIVFEKKLLTYWDKFKQCCGKNNESLNEKP